MGTGAAVASTTPFFTHHTPNFVATSAMQISGPKLMRNYTEQIRQKVLGQYKKQERESEEIKIKPLAGLVGTLGLSKHLNI